MKQKALVGTTTSTKAIMVETGMVQRFVDALDITDPLSREPDAAREAGLRGPMLPFAAAPSLGDYQSVIDLLELKPKQVLHSQETFAIFDPLCVGDELTVTTTLRDLYEQQVGGNPMGFVTIDVVGTGKKGDVRFEAQRVLAIRGGFPRR